jgi:hypothetical protein
MLLASSPFQQLCDLCLDCHYRPLKRVSLGTSLPTDELLGKCPYGLDLETLDVMFDFGCQFDWIKEAMGWYMDDSQCISSC